MKAISRHVGKKKKELNIEYFKYLIKADVHS